MALARGKTTQQGIKGKTTGLSQENTGAKKGHVYEGLSKVTGRGVVRKK